MMHYIEVDGVPLPANLLEWARWHENHNRTVAKTDVGKAHVSTVFLGLDHSFGQGPPLLYETMVFGLPEGHPLDQECDRYSTRQEALAGHEAMVMRVKMAHHL
jgi:hypothetical protein